MTDKHDKLVELLRETGAEEAVAGLFYVTAKDIAAFASAHVASLCADVEPFVFEEYPYHYEAMGCGLEDRNITDRYEAMAYGWERAMERAAEAIPDDLYPASTVAAITAQRDAALSRATDWKRLYDRAINEANGLTNYVEDRPELRSAERRLDVIYADARALKGQP